MVLGLNRAIATKSILFIDPTVEDYQSLIGGLAAENRQDACSTKIVILDAYRDGISQISETLARNKGLKAVHILSHGGPGRLYLGNSQLSNETVGRYTSQLRQWGEALGENADILIYGCQVGADLAFVRQLRELTGANIAASATPTGNAKLGGDWNLEVTVGEVSSSVVFESATMEAYSGILDRLFAIKDDGSYEIVELNPSSGVEINSFSLPEGLFATPQGLAFDGNSLFLVDNGSPHTLFELDPDTGAIRDFDTISGLVTVDGLAVIERKVYLLDSSTIDIIEFDPISDTVTNTLDIDLENPGISVGGGLAGITGPNALLAISNNSELVEINPTTGGVTGSFLLPGGTGYGVAAIDNEIYVSNNNLPSAIEVFDRAGVSQRTIDNLPGISALGGDDILEGILYFSEDSAMNANGLYSLDTATGSSTFLGESGSMGINVGLAPSNDKDSLYGSEPYNLLTVSTDGSGVIPITDSNIENIQGLAFDYTREILYGIDGSSFFTLNQNTGNKTALASPPTSLLQALAYGNGGVYALGDGQQNLQFYDANTKAWSVVGDTGQVWPNAGLAFDPFNNVLYAKSSDDSFLYQIDPDDATTTQIGDTGSNKGGGLAFSLFQVPPPQESNDTLTLASYTGLTGSNYGSFNYSGEIDTTSDVDLFHVYLGRGDRLAVTPSDLLDASQQSVGVPEIRIFDASGAEIQQQWSFSPTEDTDYFTAPLSGSYYLGISSTNNSSYDPKTENSGSGSNTGTYDLSIETIDTGKQRLFAVSSDGTKIIELDPTTGTEVNSFDAPESGQGLAFDGDRLFFINGIGKLWELDPNNGTVIDFDETNIAGTPEGLAVLGGKVYILDSQNKDIIEFNPLSSSVTNTLDIDVINTDVSFLAGGLAGITEPDALLVTGQLNSTPKVLEINPATGEITDSFDANGSGLAVINGEIYVGDSSIEVFNRNGVSQRTINLPGNISALGSDDIPSDEPILYFNRDERTDGLYSLDINTGTPTLIGTSDSNGSNVGLAPSGNSELLYGSKPYDKLVEINADGSGTNSFSDGFASGLAYDRSQDILYGIDGGSFFSLDVSSGNLPSFLASPPTTIEGLAFGNNGVYGVGSGDQKLWFYDPTTNNWSEIGNTGQNWWQAGLAFDSNNNVLYAKGGQDNFLYQIDVSNAQTTVIGDTGFLEGGGLAFVVPGNTPTEANDTISQASATGLTVDNPGVFAYTGEIGDNNNVAPESDVDLFQFQLGVGEEVQFSLPEVFDETGMKTGDAVVLLFDSSGNDLGISNPSGFSTLWEDTPESKPYGSYTTTEAGTFYLGISAENNSLYNANSEGSGSGDADKIGSYTLTIETIDRPMGTDEPNDILDDAVATGLTLDSPGSYSYTGEIGDNTNILQALDVDLFEFELDIGETVRFNLPQRRDESDSLIANTEVRLFDASGTQLDWEADGLDYGQFTAENAGTFYLGVSDFNLNAYDPTTIEGRSAFGNSYVEGGTYELTIEKTGNSPMTSLYDNITVTPDDTNAAANGPWLTFDNRSVSNPASSGDAAQFVDVAGTILNTTGGGDNQTDGSNDDNSAGYSNYFFDTDDNPLTITPGKVNDNFPALNADNGYTLSFTLEVIEEQNNGVDLDGDGKNDRAGFSVSLVSEDTSKAIEISFEKTRVWAQDIAPGGTSTSDLFQAEGVDFTTTATVNYDLEVAGQDNKYYLFADGELILEGDLRDYSAVESGFSGFTINPYGNQSSISLSDRTDDARSIVELSEIGVTTADATPTDLFISEYVEGSSNNKAIELYNGTGGAIDLTDYSLEFYANGNATSTTTIDLSGTVASGDVFVLADDGADATILAQADQTSASSFFNGDDAIVLKKGVVVLDAIGQVGTDPGTEWGSGDVSTQDNTLRRRPSINGGDTNELDAFDPSTEWYGFATDTFDGLGIYRGVNSDNPDNAENDFNSDRFGDLLIFNSNTGDNYIRFTDGTNSNGSSRLSNIGSGNDGWKVVDVKDFNNNGFADILIYNSNTGDNYIRFTDGTNSNGSSRLSNIGSGNDGWGVADVEDFNNDGFADLLIFNSNTGDNYIRFTDGTNSNGSSQLPDIGNGNDGWGVADVEDFNNDGFADILIFNSNTGDNYIRFTDGTDVTGSSQLSDIGSGNDGWGVADVEDFNNDGFADILIFNSNTGDNYIRFTDGTDVTGSSQLSDIGNGNDGWGVADVEDFNNDGFADILIFNSNTGDNYLRFTDGTNVTGSSQLSDVGSGNDGWGIIS